MSKLFIDQNLTTKKGPITAQDIVMTLISTTATALFSLASSKESRGNLDSHYYSFIRNCNVLCCTFGLNIITCFEMNTCFVMTTCLDMATCFDMAMFGKSCQYLRISALKFYTFGIISTFVG